MRDRARHLTGQLAGWFVLLWVIFGFAAAQAATSDGLPPSNRVDIDLGQTPWKYKKDVDDDTFSQPGIDDSGWQSKGVPQSPSDNDTFLNLESGGGEGQLTGNIIWYRKHFTLDPSYANRKILIEFEGANTGARVFVNGTFIKGNSAVPTDAGATHVQGFVPFEIDATSLVKFDGSDNVIAVETARNANWFETPSFSGAFRFGQDDSGLYRHVWMHITDKVHIPENTFSVLQTWGTYVATVAASPSSATIRVQTNVLNENPVGQADRQVTLTTQIVDQQGNVVSTAQDVKTVPSNAGPALTPTLFDQVMTVQNPILWYPNNSPVLSGKPYMYHVIHTVSVNGTVVDSKESPLGIRTITWDQNFPYFNGTPHYLWGASGRYDYPALGSAVPDNLKWNDLYLLAQAGGSLWRPGHSSEGPVFLDAADEYGIMVMQPSGDGENGFSAFCTDTVQQNCASPNNWTLKQELHRDMIIHDRNHPSVLAWEADNGATATPIAQALKVISQQWDPINTRAQADRTPNPNNGDLLGCSGNGCDIGVKNQFPDSPSVGSEYWGDGVGRAKYDFEIQFAASYVNNWVHSVLIKSMGIAHWYLADTPGEINTQTDGTLNTSVRSNGASMMDEHRLPRLIYYIYEAIWTSFQRKPVVKLAYHWNRSGPVTVNAFSNCPSVRLLLNDQPVGPDQTPNPTTSDSSANLTQSTTLLPGQVHWDNVQWVPGTLKALCLDASGQTVAQDVQVTAGPADHIVLTVEPETPKPDGTQFDLRANGTDAAVITARVVDQAGNLVPDAAQEITFNVPSADVAGEYRGGSDHYVTRKSDGTTDLGFHAPGDPKVFAEGGMTRVVVKTTFVPGTVHVTASADGLGSGSTSFDVLPVISQQTFDGKDLVIGAQQQAGLQIITQPLDQTVTVGQTATFTVLAAGASPQFQWTRNGQPISGANSFSYTTPATVAGDDNAAIAVTVSNASGSIPSQAATLHVVAPAAPQIQTQPAAQSVQAGQNATFSVVATGSPTLTYQWLKNGQPIQGATQPVYNTPPATTDDNSSMYSVVVTNSAGTTTSGTATLSVGAATPPKIVSQPNGTSVPVGQSVTFNVVASGSDPLTYQWTKSGVAVGTNSPQLIIPSASNSDSGDYIVTVSNAAGSVSTTPFTLAVSGGDNTNLALGATASSSPPENDGLAASFANDGNTTTTRWSSQQDDNAFIQLDFHTPKTFDEVTIVWENAFAKLYKLQWSNDGQTWTDIAEINGQGHTETTHFPSTTAQFIRMQGEQRATNFGYSMFEFEVFDTPQCGPATERYTPIAAQPGTYQSTIAGLPSGPFVPTVKDNVSGLTWQQLATTFPGQGAQFTQVIAKQYCASVNMRVPTQNEALTVAGANFSSCAFPGPWTTWTTTADPGQADRAFTVSSVGESVSQIIDNTPVAALCVSGPTLGVPTINAQPANQTVSVGQTATFAVGVAGTGPFRFEWSENGKLVGITTTNSFTTAPVTAQDSGAVFTVSISNGGGTVQSQPATLTIGDVGTGGGGTGNGGGTGDGGGTTGGGGGGGGGAAPTGPSADLALGKTVTASGVESDNFLASQAVDGNQGTRWSSAFTDPQTLEVDLGSPQTVDRVVIDWENSFGVAYTIDTSTDNQNWQNAFTQTNGKGGQEDLRFAARTAQFVRFTGTQRATQFGYSMFEFGVYNTAATPQYPITATVTGNGTITPAGVTSVLQGGPQTYTFTPADGFAVTDVLVDGVNIGMANSYTFPDVEGPHTINVTFAPASAAVNLALGAGTSTSGGLESDAFPASNVVDGDLTSRWSSAFSDPQTITLDLKSVKTFDRVVLFWQDAHATDYQIQTSTDKVNWTVVANRTNSPGGVEQIDFDPVSAQYVQMVGTKRNTGFGYSLFEFQVFNVPVAPAITTPPATVSVTQGATAQFSVVASGTPPLTYQWLKNGQPVATTTVPTYTTPPTVASDSGATFSVIVSNAAGTTQPSAGATLSVTAPVGSGDGSSTGTSSGTSSGDGTGSSSTGTGTGDGGSTGSTGTGNNSSAAAPSSPNLALGMPVDSTGQQDDGDPASNAVDGNLGSRWSSNFADDASMTVDLGQPKLFDRVVLRWEAAFGKAYVLEASNDKQTWTPIFTQNAGAGGTEDISVPATTARYVRMQGVQRATQFGYSLFEFEIYNSAATPKLAITASSGANGSISPSGAVSVNQAGSQTFTAVPAAGFGVGTLTVDGQDVGMQSSYTFNDVTTPHSISVSFVPLAATVNLALHKAVTTSGLEDPNGGNPAAAAVDGDPTTRWASAHVDPSFITVDFGAQTTFDRVVLSWENAHAIAYQIQTSDDNTNWTTVYNQTNSQGGIEDLKLQAPATARYVRMFGTQRSTPYGYSLFEFQVFNSGAGASTTPQATSLIEQPATQTVPLGQNGHFAVLAAGAGPFTYQWRRNGTPITGATARTYDTAATTAADNGAVFSVVVTGPNGPSTSSDAQLSVDSTIPNYPVTPGFIGVDLANNTNGAFTDDQVYIAVIARDPANNNQFAWLKPDGTVTPAAIADNDAPNHLTGPDGQNYSNYFFTLAQAKKMQLPHISSGRMFVSLGSPLFIKILADANGQVGFAGPNPQNPTDPNVKVPFDWIEFDYGGNTLFINTTQVDEFGIPLVEDIYGSNHTFHQRTGITMSSADIFAAYAKEVSAPFQAMQPSKLRIMAPAKASFAAGQPNGNFFDDYVNQMWQTYASQNLVLNLFGNRQFVGKVQGDQFVFTEVDLHNGGFVGGTFTVNKPSTQDVLLGAGTLATGDSTTLQIEAQMCAAFNRHVVEDVSKWAQPTAWWSNAPTNEYARFFHDHSVSGLAYGFAYDDVSNGSSSIVATQPEHMVLGIGW
ncbi:discoidin domain-containing protein [Paraburkholderia rhizosphaerae]|uniref:Immunoglobulin I-set domain protein n=1 Tax=Paraburkholderia rhizosphaerae TaxID=480658 RepID=A0A4R8L554_9BURK|nr:discoidin domain-containing protein [Paraburkholderia rhizosphaerae]TDY37693.1 immunoglobulin I-set domain protein [Paraburkholderia rhizosphaerae]